MIPTKDIVPSPFTRFITYLSGLNALFSSLRLKHDTVAVVGRDSPIHVKKWSSSQMGDNR
ncbi:hypothetical protein BLOT_002590 [Blomia tropicalis]|nr:hypothetical protein BLOT_002590 [Blomia tropicalis]